MSLLEDLNTCLLPLGIPIETTKYPLVRQISITLHG